jgi:major membrane immunogen (membrane-anchored lipoprotein)
MNLARVEYYFSDVADKLIEAQQNNSVAFVNVGLNEGGMTGSPEQVQ